MNRWVDEMINELMNERMRGGRNDEWLKG